MFRREAPAPSPEVLEAVRKTARERAEARDAEVFKPSSFASRKADAEARNGARASQRLVSLGQSDYWQRNLKGKDEYIEVELFMDVDHPSRLYVQLPGRAELFPLHNSEGKTEKVEPLGAVSKSRRFVSTFPEAGPTTVTPI